MLYYLVKKGDCENLVHLNTSLPFMEVAKGDVWFGINPDIINIRKASYSIVLNCDDIFDENIQKYYNNFFGFFKWQNNFDKFIEIREDLYVGQLITLNFIVMNSWILI